MGGMGRRVGRASVRVGKRGKGGWEFDDRGLEQTGWVTDDGVDSNSGCLSRVGGEGGAATTTGGGRARQAKGRGSVVVGDGCGVDGGGGGDGGIAAGADAGAPGRAAVATFVPRVVLLLLTGWSRGGQIDCKANAPRNGLQLAV